jgi:hypothetical protein
MGGEKPGWYYAGNGQLRYHDGDGLTDQYKPIEGPQATTVLLDTEPSDTRSNKSPDVKKPHRRTSHFVIALCVALLALGVGGGLLKAGVLSSWASWASAQAGQGSTVKAPPAPTKPATAVKPKVKAKVPATVTHPKAVAPKAVAAPLATHASSSNASPVTRAPAAIDNFNKAYARQVTADLVDDVATADKRFLDHPELGASTTMGFLSADMSRLLNAGMPPVADKAHYYALVTTLEKFYGEAADQLPDDVMGAAVTYTVARQSTSELLGLLNPVLGTKYALAKWSFV